MTEQVRIGVVGTSWWADLLPLPSLKSHPGAQIAAICGRNRDRAEELAKKYEIPAVFTDYRTMIAHGDLQAIAILVPDDLHYPITMDALDAGLHVLCEKPLASTTMQARAMYEKAQAVGVKHMIDFTYRAFPTYRYLDYLLKEGYLGRCYHCNIRYFAGYGRSAGYGWRFDRQRSNGILADLGSHMIDLARWFGGEIATVHAQFGSCVDRAGVGPAPLDPANDMAILAVQFRSGTHGVIHVSAVAHVANRIQEQHVLLHGEAGTLESAYSFTGGSEIRGARAGEEQFSTLSVPDEFLGDTGRRSGLEIFFKQSVGARQFIDAILEDRPVVTSFYDGYKVQEVIDAALESQRSGAQILLD